MNQTILVYMIWQEMWPNGLPTFIDLLLMMNLMISITIEETFIQRMPLMMMEL